MSRILLAIMMAAPLSGCLTTLYLSDRPSPAMLSEMKRRCEQDAALRWFGERPYGIDVWMPGNLSRDPADDPGFQTASQFIGIGSGEDLWLRSGVARALYINMGPGDGYYFGPTRGEPSGVYKFELAPDGDARCEAETAWFARQAARGASRPASYIGRCLTYSYVGKAPADAAVFVRFDDAPEEARGLYRSGERLIVDGRLRASITDYWAVNPSSAAERRGQWGLKACQHLPQQGLLRLFPDNPDAERPR